MPDHADAEQLAHQRGLMALLVGAAFPLLGPLNRLDLTFFDLEMKQAWRLREPRPIDDVVLVALDDKTLASVAEPMALMHVQVGAFLTAMADAHAHAVAVDLVLPNRSFEGVALGYDAVHLGVHSVKGHSSVDVYGWNSSHQTAATSEFGASDSLKTSNAT